MRSTSGLAGLLLMVPALACSDDGGNADVTATEGEPGDGEPGDGEPGDGEPGDGDGDGDACGTFDSLEIGGPVGRFVGMNPEGELVDTCDYVGTPYVIDLSAMWCEPCQGMSGCLAGDDMACTDINVAPTGMAVRAMLAEGSAAWITILIQDETSMDATIDDVIAWDMLYPAPGVVTITNDSEAVGPLQAFALPTIHTVDDSGRWFALENWSTYEHLEAFVEAFGS